MTVHKPRSALLWQFARQRPVLLVVAVAARSAWEIIPVALPFMAGAIVDNLHGNHDTAVTQLDTGMRWGLHELLLAGMFGLAGIAGLLAVLRSITMAYAGRTLVSFARAHVAKRLLNSSGLHSGERSPGAWLGLLQRDCAMLRGLLEKALIRAVTSVLRLLGPIIGMFAISWPLTCIIIGVWLMPLWIITRLERQLRQFTRDLSTAQDDFTQIAKQLIDGRESLLGCGAQGFALSMIETAISRIETVQLRIARRSAWVQACLWSTAILAIALCWTIGTGQISSETMTLGQLIAFVGLLELAQRPVRSYARVARTLQSTSVAEERLEGVLNESVGSRELLNQRSQALAAVRTADESVLSVASLNLRVGDRLVVDCLTHQFRIPSLTVIAGKSGCGKSTLLRALAGLVPIESGQIIFRLDAREDHQGDVSPFYVLLVPQRPWIFDGTLRDNVTAGLSGICEERLASAAKASGVDSYLSELGGGWETIIGDHGVRLSGGQLLRLTLCRAILRQPKVLLLDEPTAGLDSVSERLVLKQLKMISRHTLVVMAAHRDACIEAADEVLWLSDKSAASRESGEKLHSSFERVKVEKPRIGDQAATLAAEAT